MRKLAVDLRKGSRESDVICRYGGEEFIVVMRGMSVAHALQRMESWRISFANTPMKHQGAVIRITLSAGIAAFPEHGPDIDTLLSHADEALYWAKDEGRNRVAVYRSEGAGGSEAEYPSE